MSSFVDLPATHNVIDYTAFQYAYQTNPVAFVFDCFNWNAGRHPAPYQEAILTDFVKNKKVSVRAPHGVGKTAVAAWLIIWFALTRDGNPRFEDWKIPTTASAWRQLTKFLWPEVHKWARRVNWEKVGRPSFYERRELLQFQLKMHTGEAFAAASDQPATMEGAHAESMLYLFDESKTITDEIFNVADGAMMAAGDDTGVEAYAFAISTPGEPQGHFYDIHRRAPGFEDWRVHWVKIDDGITAGRVSRDKVERLKRQWGGELPGLQAPGAR